MSLVPGQTQYLRYGNSFLRGHCVSEGCVQVSWGTGFFQSVKVDNWDSREFLQHPQVARLLAGEEAEQAEAFFARPPTGTARPLVARHVRDIDPAVLGRAFLDTMGDPDVHWSERPFKEFSDAMAARVLHAGVRATPKTAKP